MIPSQLKIALAAAGALLFVSLAGAVLVQRAEKEALQTKVTSLTADNERLVTQIEVMDAQFNRKLDLIKALEQQRRENETEIAPLIDRLDHLPAATPGDSDAQDAFVRDLNSLNGDANRMFERATR